MSIKKKQQAIAHLQAQRWQKAKAILAKLCTPQSKDSEPWFLLGVVNGELGLLDEAIHCNRQAIRLNPNSISAYSNLGNMLLAQGNPADALACYQAALLRKPDFAEARYNMGNCLQKIGKLEEAMNAYRVVLDGNPNFAPAHNNLGKALQDQGLLEEALAAYRSALRCAPQFPEAHNNLGNVYHSQGRLEEAAPHYRRALSYRPDFVDARVNLLFCLNASPVDPAEVFREHYEWGQRIATFGAASTNHNNSCANARPLRVGYVSADLYQHSVAFFLEPLLRNHNSGVVEVFCYADVENPDAVTEQLQAHAQNWRNIRHLTHAQLAQQILSDKIDILVDLAGHSPKSRLPVFALKPAPVQITYLGYPNTTGLQTMDYRFTDEWADPTGTTEQWHAETLMRIPEGFLCYRPPPNAPPVTTLPARSTGSVTFGSFNAQTKVTPAVLRLWARILQAIPDARLVLKNRSLGHEATQRFVHEVFAKEGISAERVKLSGWVLDIMNHCSWYGQVDIALDSFPYNGTTTTCESLWMGVPVVTLAGQSHVGRVGVSLLSQVDLTQFIAHNPEQYVETALHWANNLDALAEVRAGLRQKMEHSSLCDGKSFAGKIENIYRSLWDTWCSTKNMAVPQHEWVD